MTEILMTGLVSFLGVYLTVGTIFYSLQRNDFNETLGPPPGYWVGWCRWMTARYFRTGEWLWKSARGK